MESDEEQEEIMPLPSSMRQRQERQPIEQITSTTIKGPGRATRFLSIVDPSSQLPNPAALMKLRQIHDQSQLNDEISDDVLDNIPFQ